MIRLYATNEDNDRSLWGWIKKNPISSAAIGAGVVLAGKVVLDSDMASRLHRRQTRDLATLNGELAAKIKNMGVVASKIGSVSISAFSSELEKIANVSNQLGLAKDPSDILDRRTIRKFRKPNPRILPAPQVVSKLVK